MRPYDGAAPDDDDIELVQQPQMSNTKVHEHATVRHTALTLDPCKVAPVCRSAELSEYLNAHSLRCVYVYRACPTSIFCYDRRNQYKIDLS